jgi:hypothetical protein
MAHVLMSHFIAELTVKMSMHNLVLIQFLSFFFPSRLVLVFYISVFRFSLKSFVLGLIAG